jgi:hypothetical protein
MPLPPKLNAGSQSYPVSTKRFLEVKNMRTWIKRIMAGILMGSLVLSSLPALAQPQNFDINRRIRHHQERIQQAANSGQLTPKEYNRLEKELARIQRLEAKMMRDGFLSPPERAELQRELDANSHNINLAIQNKGYRPPPPPRY